MKRLWLSIAALLFVTGCGRLETIPYTGHTPETWCQAHPCVPVDLGFIQFIITEPTSSFLIYFLGILTVFIGVYMYKRRESDKSRFWFATALIFWGVAALSAGTSYQAFSYEIKCAGREVCSWTSWWEIYYYMFQSFSMNAFVAAVAYSSTSGTGRRLLKIYAIINVIAYNIILFTGAFLPDKFMVSFELFTLFTGPNFLILFIINTVNYIREKDPLELRLLILWSSQGLIVFVYFVYLLMGFTESLWKQGIWFSANDVLHLLIIFWQLYIFFSVVKRVRDKLEKQ